MALVQVGGGNESGTIYVNIFPAIIHGTLLMLNVTLQPECEGSLGENGYV